MTGVYDGMGHKIIGLKENREDGGLFFRNEGTIKNLGIVNSEIRGKTAGSITCLNYGTILNCYNTGIICNRSYPQFENTYVKIGGIAAENAPGGMIKNCYNTGTVNALATLDSNSYIQSSCGGIVAINGNSHTAIPINPSSVINCYSAGKINEGGIAGLCRMGGIVGYSYPNHKNIANCYYNSDVMNADDYYHDGIGEGVIDIDRTWGISTTGMKEDTFIDRLNKNIGIDEPWHIDSMNQNNGYPVFQYQFSQASPINQNGDLITIKNISDSTCITIAAPELTSEDIVPIIAMYDENGLLAIHTNPDYTLIDNTITLNQVNLKVPPTTTKIAIFIWKDLQTIQPLTECYYIQ